MTAYYNEIDPYAAQWLRNLIAAGHIAPGDVDERSIEDVRPDEISGYRQHHFFAGIGVWSHALRTAGWDDSRRVWTGSCPCQPFSAAGKGAGFADERHLWPAWFHLIGECRPDAIFGEQVAGKNGLTWLDLIQSDLEGLDYACGAVVAPAAGFGAPHIRERLYWGAYADNERPQGRNSGELSECANQRAPGPGDSSGGLVNSESDGRQRRPDDGDEGRRQCASGQASEIVRSGPTNGFWRDADWLFCTDRKWRPVEARVQQMVDGRPIRVGRLRADLAAKTEEILDEATKRLQTTREEILHAVREAFGAEDIFGEAGSTINTQQAQILLAYLFEFTGQTRNLQNTENDSGASVSRRDLCVLWRRRASGNTPHQRRLGRQPLRELTDSLCLLSSAVARAAQEAGYPVLYTDAPASFPLSRQAGGGAQKCENLVGYIRPNRVGKLRAYGNAIVAPQAAAFIEAAMEYRP